MEFKQVLQTKNITPWINTKEFIVLHHTATQEWTIKWVLNTLTTWAVSCHYVIDINWDIYKIWNDDNILWHAWVSFWQWKENLNQYSIWIEVIWPLKRWFTNEQKKSVKELVSFLMEKYNIKPENLIRHKDIAPWRKTDIADIFWNNEFKTWKDYQTNYKSMETLQKEFYANQLQLVILAISNLHKASWEDIELKKKLEEINSYLKWK